MHDIIGLDVGGTQIKMAAFSPEGEMLQNWSRDTQDAPSDGVPLFATTVAQLIGERVKPGARVGIAAPGVVSRDGRSVAYQPNKMHGIEGFDWTRFLRSERIVPVLNDAHAALLGELWKGAARGKSDVVLLTLGTGVGGAIISGGRLLKGAIGRAGHIGHISVTDNDELSIFGVPGALESAIGNYSLSSRSGGRYASTRLLVEDVEARNVTATEIWMRSLRILARALVSVINLLDPERIIIGGGIANAGKALFQPLQEMIDSIEWRPGGRQVEIVPAELGEWAGAYGAAWNAINERQR